MEKEDIKEILEQVSKGIMSVDDAFDIFSRSETITGKYKLKAFTSYYDFGVDDPDVDYTSWRTRGMPLPTEEERKEIRRIAKVRLLEKLEDQITEIQTKPGLYELILVAAIKEPETLQNRE